MSTVSSVVEEDSCGDGVETTKSSLESKEKIVEKASMSQKITFEGFRLFRSFVFAAQKAKQA